jgi:aspartate ammonia-lyase
MRTEHDLLGELLIDDDAYYGVHTARALDNFAITGVPIHPALVEALVTVKKAAAATNRNIGAMTVVSPKL